jgi:hypothetical protein
MAGLAGHASAEPGSLVVRSRVEDRAWLLEDAPDTYYVTDYYERHPVVLVRLDRIDAAVGVPEAHDGEARRSPSVPHHHAHRQTHDPAGED